MYSIEEKRSLISEMIAFAKADKKIKEEEYQFIRIVAEQLQLSKEDVDALFDKQVDYVPVKPESQRILQFHRLVLLMNVDQEANQQELRKIKELGLKMGLRAEAIDTVLREMFNYENKVIPPGELINIFKRHYN